MKPVTTLKIASLKEFFDTEISGIVTSKVNNNGRIKTEFLVTALQNIFVKAECGDHSAAVKAIADKLKISSKDIKTVTTTATKTPIKKQVIEKETQTECAKSINLIDIKGDNVNDIKASEKTNFDAINKRLNELTTITQEIMKRLVNGTGTEIPVVVSKSMVRHRPKPAHNKPKNEGKKYENKEPFLEKRNNYHPPNQSNSKASLPITNLKILDKSKSVDTKKPFRDSFTRKHRMVYWATRRKIDSPSSSVTAEA